MEVSDQPHGPAALLTRREPRYLLDRRLGGPQNRSGGGGKEKNSQPLLGLELPIIQPVAQRSYSLDAMKKRKIPSPAGTPEHRLSYSIRRKSKKYESVSKSFRTE
jgi:hypothetical protein